MSGKGYKILLAEDEGIVAMDIRSMLNKRDMQVVSLVNSGVQLIREYKKHNPDLIISDIYLKGKVNGIQAITEITRDKKIPVILLTGSEQILSDIPFSFDYITKPFKDSDLIDKVLRHLSQDDKL